MSVCIQSTNTIYVNPTGYGLLYNHYAVSRTTSTVNFGYLYNWYAAADAREIANTGWRVASEADYAVLYTAIPGTEQQKSLKVCEPNIEYWQVITDGTNELKFNGRGSGLRLNFDGTFVSLRGTLNLWTSTEIDINNARCYYIALGLQFNLGWDNKKGGKAIRLIKNSTVLANGQVGTYIGNDGKIYATICIGTQEWLSENLAETKYRNGNDIPEVTNNTTWAGLVIGARSSYNNDEIYALTINDYLAPTGWSIPTKEQWNTLAAYVSATFQGADKLKETGTFHWTIDEGTDNYGFKAVAGGRREVDGDFDGMLDYALYWSKSIYAAPPNTAYHASLINGDDTFIGNNTGDLFKVGESVKCIKNSTILTHSQRSTVTDYDGNIYNTVCIGTQEWMIENLVVQHYNDGIIIPDIQDNVEWSNLITGACCAYNNNWSYAGVDKITNLEEEMKYPIQTINLSAGVETEIVTSLTTKPYNIELLDSTGKVIESTVLTRVALSGGVYHIYIYSAISLNNVELYILY